MRAPCLTTVLPSVTWPSPARTARSSRRTARMVVAWKVDSIPVVSHRREAESARSTAVAQPAPRMRYDGCATPRCQRARRITYDFAFRCDSPDRGDLCWITCDGKSHDRRRTTSARQRRARSRRAAAAAAAPRPLRRRQPPARREPRRRQHDHQPRRRRRPRRTERRAMKASAPPCGRRRARAAMAGAPESQRRQQRRSRDRDHDNQRVAVPREGGHRGTGRSNNAAGRSSTATGRHQHQHRLVVSRTALLLAVQYDRWARHYYRWSPIGYAPWSLIYGSIGDANFGLYGVGRLGASSTTRIRHRGADQRNGYPIRLDAAFDGDYAVRHGIVDAARIDFGGRPAAGAADSPPTTRRRATSLPVDALRYAGLAS